MAQRAWPTSYSSVWNKHWPIESFVGTALDSARTSLGSSRNSARQCLDQVARGQAASRRALRVGTRAQIVGVRRWCRAAIHCARRPRGVRLVSIAGGGSDPRLNGIASPPITAGLSEVVQMGAVVTRQSPRSLDRGLLDFFRLWRCAQAAAMRSTGTRSCQARPSFASSDAQRYAQNRTGRAAALGVRITMPRIVSSSTTGRLVIWHILAVVIPGRVPGQHRKCTARAALGVAASDCRSMV